MLALLLAKPYQVLPLPKDAASYAARLHGDSAVWLTGDVLTFAHRRRAGYVGVTGGVQESMHPVPGTDLWVLPVRMRGWDRATIQYAFFTPERPSPPYEAYRVWRGPQAPILELSTPLKGKLQTTTLQGRTVMVYLPPNPPRAIPAFFLADGESTEGFAQALEPLIQKHRMRPAAIVGVFGGPTRMQDFRSRAFQRFFASELPTWATRTFGISKERTDRAAVGYSSGGRFVATVGASFGTVVPLASGSVPTVNPRPRDFFAVGTLDPAYSGTTRAAKRLNAPCETPIGGHDFELWRLAFSRIAPQLFPLDPDATEGPDPNAPPSAALDVERLAAQTNRP